MAHSGDFFLHLSTFLVDKDIDCLCLLEAIIVLDSEALVVETCQNFAAGGPEHEFFKLALLCVIDGTGHVGYRDPSLHIVIRSALIAAVLAEEVVITVITTVAVVASSTFFQEITFWVISLLIGSKEVLFILLNFLSKDHLSGLLKHSVVLNQVIHLFFHLASSFILLLDESLRVGYFFVNHIEKTVKRGFTLLCLRFGNFV